MPEEQLLFSVDHMSMSNSFNVNQYDGGELIPWEVDISGQHGRDRVYDAG